MIAVTGASGRLGGMIVSMLSELAPGTPAVALARSPDKAPAFGPNVEIRAFDYNDPDQILAGLEGVETLLLVSSSEVGLREVQHRNVIMGAMTEGVQRIVYTSMLHAPVSPMKLAAEHLATELILRESGIPCTILRNGWYAENYIDTARGALAAGMLCGAAAGGRISAAARADYACAAVEVLLGEGHEGEVYELAGDEGVTLAELAAEISALTGAAIPYRDMGEAEYAQALAEAGLAAPWPEFLAAVDAQIAGGALFEDGRALSRLIGRPTTPLREVLAAALARAA